MIPIAIVISSLVVSLFAAAVMYLSFYWPSDEAECISKQIILNDE